MQLAERERVRDADQRRALGAVGLGEPHTLGLGGAPDHVEHGPQLGGAHHGALALEVEVRVLRVARREALVDEALERVGEGATDAQLRVQRGVEADEML